MKNRIITLASHLYGTLDRRSPLVILTLHRVGPSRRIRTEDLRRHLSYLTSRYRMILPSQLEDAPSGERLAMVTIDDCHEDIHDVIFPVARDLRCPICVAVPTDFFLRNRWLWFDKLRYGWEQSSPGRKYTAAGMDCMVGDSGSEARVKQQLKALTPDAREALLQEITSALGVEVPDSPVAGFRPVGLDDMKTLVSTGLVELCAHTVTHTIATSLSEEQFRQEASRSKEELEGFTGSRIDAFCYPNGEERDFDATNRSVLHELGYTQTFTAIKGLNRRATMDPLALKRIHANARFSAFLKEASGLGDFQRSLLR